MSFRDWAATSWYHVVDSGNIEHFRAGIQVARARSWGGVMCYAAKYIAKVDDDVGFLEQIPIGRCWGVLNRKGLPWAQLMEFPLDDEMAVRIRRIARRYLERVRKRRIRCPFGLTLYCDTSQWVRLFARPPDNPF